MSISSFSGDFGCDCFVIILVLFILLVIVGIND